ncbi:glycosyltransferase family 2 protein [Sutterella wadsworthensis]|uniref:glycosyltransferase family 2 protein n=1 Tax=Sutterella wadsworthensis TaxID=40545 RepID=UPI003AF5871A
MLFSIIIPGFNCSETIYNAISSIVDQNYLDLEIIYCDDCSEDDSVNVVKRIANKNKSIKIFQSDKNRGPGYLRNTGTKLASGRFVIYLDADDWLEMGILGKLANVIYSHPSIELIEYRINIVKNNVSEEGNWLNRGENGIRYTDKEDILLATGNGNKCIKKELIVNNLLENVVNNRSGEEVPFYLMIYKLAGKFYYLNEPGLNICVSDISLSRNNATKDLFLHGIFVVLENLKSELIRLNKYDEAEYASMCQRILGWALIEKQSLDVTYFIFYYRAFNFLKNFNAVPKWMKPTFLAVIRLLMFRKL